MSSPNSDITITFQNQKTTITNPLSTRLCDDDRVIFSGVRNPHPLMNVSIVRVITNDDVDAIDVVDETFTSLASTIEAFKSELSRKL